MFDPFESSIGHHRDQGGRNRTGQKQRRVDGCQAAKNKDAESTAADGRGNRRRPDRRDGRDPQTGQNRPSGQGQFDLPEQLPSRHTHANRRFTHRGVHIQNAGECISQNRQERISHERDNGRVLADAAEEGKRNQKPKECQTRYGLHDVRKSQYPSL